MTRMEKYAQKRAKIEKENKQYMITNFYDYMMLICSQRQIKQEMGCKH